MDRCYYCKSLRPVNGPEGTRNINKLGTAHAGWLCQKCRGETMNKKIDISCKGRLEYINDESMIGISVIERNDSTDYILDKKVIDIRSVLSALNGKQVKITIEELDTSEQGKIQPGFRECITCNITRSIKTEFTINNQGTICDYCCNGTS